MNAPSSLTAAALGTALCLTSHATAQTTAGVINWLPVTNIKGVTDVNKTGRLCIAVNCGPETPDVVVNGVHFMADRAHWTRKILTRGGPVVRGQMYWPDKTSGGFTLKMPFDRAAGQGVNPIVTDPNYKTALSSGRHKSPTYPSTIVCAIEGLTPGNRYLIQIWAANSSNGRTTEWDNGNGGREGKGGIFLGAAGTTKGQYALGTFTAAANGIQKFTNFQQKADATKTPPLKDTWGWINMIQIREMNAKPNTARATYYGPGTPGTNTQPNLGGSKYAPYVAISAHPKVGTKVTLSADNSSDKATNALILLGVQKLNLPYLGGTLLVNPILTVGAPMPAPKSPYTHDHELQISSTLPKTMGTVYTQVLMLDAGAKGGIAMTPGMQVDIGN